MSKENIESRIGRIDLRMINAKVMRKNNWTQQRTDDAEKAYRDFLASGEPVPSPDADVFWHQHILDTNKYADDCNAVFGKFLHHVPSYVDETCDNMCKRPTVLDHSRSAQTCTKQLDA